VLVSHLDVRHGFAQPLCTDHGLAYHPCCQPGHPCPTFETSFGYDPDDSSMLSCDQMPLKGFDIDLYCNRALDVLYQQELAAADPGVRQLIFRQIHQIYLTELPFIVLYSYPYISIVRKVTHNYLPSDIEGNINTWQWWCDGGKC
jgi:peptide/nickel transport system substrate-binding protein